jgi:hypothetical protein
MWLNRPNKDYTRSLATQGDLRNHALFMPAASALCVKKAQYQNFINHNTKLTFVEQNPLVAQQLLHTIDQNNWHANLLQLPLHQTIISKLDYAWLDLNGTITKEIAAWLFYHLSSQFTNDSILCVTLEYPWRNNTWFKLLHPYISTQYQKLYSQFRYHHHILNDRNLAFPAFIVACLFRNWHLQFTDVIPYRDTTDMIFYKINLTTINLTPKLPTIDFNYQPRNYQPRTGINMTTTSQDTINAIVKAQLNPTPALKAHATRKKMAYAKQQAQLGKNPKLCLAAVQAHATRILQKM